MFNPTLNRTVILTGLLLLALVFLVGCGSDAIRRIDAAIWNIPIDPDTGEPRPGAPPVVELAAALLGLGGLGGLGAWIGKSNKNGRKAIEDLAVRVHDLEKK